jgi:hypothetical protein
MRTLEVRTKNTADLATADYHPCTQSLTFVGKFRRLSVKAPALIVKCQLATNTLAYCDVPVINAMKSFIE